MATVVVFLYTSMFCVISAYAVTACLLLLLLFCTAVGVYTLFLVFSIAVGASTIVGASTPVDVPPMLVFMLVLLLLCPGIQYVQDCFGRGPAATISSRPFSSRPSLILQLLPRFMIPLFTL